MNVAAYTAGRAEPWSAGVAESYGATAAHESVPGRAERIRTRAAVVVELETHTHWQ